MTLSKKNRAQLESFDEESVTAALEELDTLQGQLDTANEHNRILEGQIKDAKAKLADVEKKLANPPPPPPSSAKTGFPETVDDRIATAAAFVAWEEQVGDKVARADWDSAEYEKTVWRDAQIEKMKAGIELYINPPNETNPHD